MTQIYVDYSRYPPAVETMRNKTKRARSSSRATRQEENPRERSLKISHGSLLFLLSVCVGARVSVGNHGNGISKCALAGVESERVD